MKKSGYQGNGGITAVLLCPRFTWLYEPMQRSFQYEKGFPLSSLSCATIFSCLRFSMDIVRVNQESCWVVLLSKTKVFGLAMIGRPCDCNGIEEMGWDDKGCKRILLEVIVSVICGYKCIHSAILRVELFYSFGFEVSSSARDPLSATRAFRKTPKVN